jgi:thymidine kinase
MFSGKSSSIFTKLNLNPEGTRLCLVVPKNAAGFSGKGEGGEEEMPEVSMLVRNPVGVSSRVKPHAVIFLDTDMTVLMTSLLSGLLSVRSERKLVCIDESQFLLPGQIHQIQQLALFYKERGVAFELYGLKRDYLHRPFPAVRCLAGFARIKRAGHNALCPCGEPADRNVRIFTKGGGLWEIDKGEGEKIVATLEDGYSYIPTCEKHWKIGLDGLSDQIKKTLAKNTSVEKIIDPVVAKNMTVVVPKKKT